MKFARDDLIRLRVPLVFAVLLIVLGIAFLGAAEHWLAQARRARDAAKEGRAEAQKRIERAAEEERDIRSDLVRYQKMVERGMIAGENRLDMIDAIAKIKTERRLFEIRYSIDAQKRLDYPGISRAGNLDFANSRMKLEMLLLHEGDLMNFLSDLTSIGSSYVSVQRCQTSRIDRSGLPTTVQPRLRSECQIDLIVLRDARPA